MSLNQSINKSLGFLAKIFMQVKARTSHISFVYAAPSSMRICHLCISHLCLSRSERIFFRTHGFRKQLQLPRLQVDVFIGVVLLQKRQDHDAGQRVAHARVNSGVLNNRISAKSPSPHILVVDIYIYIYIYMIGFWFFTSLCYY